MKTKTIKVLLAGLILCAGNSPAAVSFVTEASILHVAAGDLLEFDLQIEITGGEQVTGVDYRWQIDAAGSGLFRLVGRDFESGKFPEENLPNLVVLANPGNILAPANSEYLGAGVSDMFVPVSTGTWLVARYTLSVDPETAPGIYTLSTFSQPGKGWVGPDPFDDFSLDQHAFLSINVVPEPRAISLLLGGLILLACRGVGGKVRLARPEIEQL